MPPMNLNLTIFGRPIKPVAFGLGLCMATFMYFNLVGMGVMSAAGWDDVVAIVSGAALSFLVIAWVANSQQIAEYGLLLSCTVFIIRATYLVLAHGFERADLYVSLGLAIIAGGSYFLERADPHVGSKI